MKSLERNNRSDFVVIWSRDADVLPVLHHSIPNVRNRIALLHYYSLGVSTAMLLFTTLQCIVCSAVLSIVKPYVRLPVRLSVKRMNCDNTNKTYTI